jgi:hypothetical protein
VGTVQFDSTPPTTQSCIAQSRIAQSRIASAATSSSRCPAPADTCRKQRMKRSLEATTAQVTRHGGVGLAVGGGGEGANDLGRAIGGLG